MKLDVQAFLSSGFVFSDAAHLWLGWGPIHKTTKFETGPIHIYAPDFLLDDPHPWFQFPFSCRMTREAFCESLSQWKALQGGVETNSELRWISPEFLKFQETFFHLKNLFKRGKLTKAVPVVFFRAECKVDLRKKAEFLDRLISNTQQLLLTLYGVWNSEGGILGATPEILFAQPEPMRIQTMALAGTRLNSIQNAQSSGLPPLLEDPKERGEHQIVIDGIVDSLSSFGEVQVGNTRELQLPTLTHLLTPIELKPHPRQSDEANYGEFFESLIRHLHPTPALGAFPRQEGFKWLREDSVQSPRDRFGAPFGLIHEAGQSVCVVSIRNLQWNLSGLTIGAGCGIVSASILEKEWEELNGKIQSVRKYFGL